MPSKSGSGALLATLSVSKLALAKDKLLALVAGLAPQLQLTMDIDSSKKAKSNLLKLELHDGKVLERRNAMLRTMCTLFRQLDFLPFCLMAGSSSYGNTALVEHQSNMAAISSWMSFATSLKDHLGAQDGSNQLTLALSQLDEYLSSRAYLVPSATASLADLSVYFAMVDLSIGVEKFQDENLLHLIRWWNQIGATVTNLMKVVIENPHNSKWITEHKELFVTSALPESSQVSPIFLYGHEENLPTVPAAASRQVSPAKSNSAVADKGAAATGGSGQQEGGGGLTDEQKQAAAEKKAKKNAEKAAKKDKNKGAGGAEGGGGKAVNAAAGGAEFDITALEIRVGLITKAWNHETADKLYCEEIDLGPDLGTRKIASGLRPFYKLEEMQNRRVLVLCNLKARSLVGFPSHGMVMCASNADHTKVEFVTAPPEAKLGERVMFEGYDDKPPEAENKVAKKKVFEKLAPDLKTDSDGIVVWKGAKATTSAGLCHAVNKMPDAQVA